jgi:hypothetical protein
MSTGKLSVEDTYTIQWLTAKVNSVFLDIQVIVLFSRCRIPLQQRQYIVSFYLVLQVNEYVIWKQHNGIIFDVIETIAKHVQQSTLGNKCHIRVSKRNIATF